MSERAAPRRLPSESAQRTAQRSPPRRLQPDVTAGGSSLDFVCGLLASKEDLELQVKELLKDKETLLAANAQLLDLVLRSAEQGGLGLGGIGANDGEQRAAAARADAAQQQAARDEVLMIARVELAEERARSAVLRRELAEAEAAAASRDAEEARGLDEAAAAGWQSRMAAESEAVRLAASELALRIASSHAVHRAEAAEAQAAQRADAALRALTQAEAEKARSLAEVSQLREELWELASELRTLRRNEIGLGFGGQRG